MLARIQSFLLKGIDAQACEVEVHHDPEAMIEGDQARVTVVGLPDVAVRESVERVRTAMSNSGFAIPLARVLINLAPADVRKEGPMYDLPIAVGLLLAQGAVRPPRGSGASSIPSRTKSLTGPGRLPQDAATHETPFEPLDPRAYLFAGELALDGRVRPVRGVIAMATLARALNARGVIVPRENAQEAGVVEGIEAIGVSTLAEVVGLLTGQLDAAPTARVDVEGLLTGATAPIDFAEVRGQESVKRAITVAAAGHHNLLMLGPAGTGKTMMARALPGVLPPLTVDEAIEITKIYSAAGQLPAGSALVMTRPVRTPHHTASAPAIVGGGAVPRPGEVSLAHRGVLFLDELPEFERDVLETMRQPLEDHTVTIARSHSAVQFPASFMLVAAMNPTPKGDMPRDQVSRAAMERYLSRLSGPLIDRIDIHVEAPAVPWSELSRGTHARGATNHADNDPPRGTSSAEMREQVLHARRRQLQRQGPTTPNARLSGKQLDQLAPIEPAARDMLGQAMQELGLSARAYDKIRRVSRTIADLDHADHISIAHVGEAIGYRLLDRKA